jgi:hypothetical protein
MASWETRWDEDSPADRWQRGMDNAWLTRRADGWEPQAGWRRPVDPACPAHGFGMVRGLCGVCVLEDKQRAEARAA